MKIQENVSLQAYNTFRIDAKAQKLVEVSTEDELREALGKVAGGPLLVLGGGSNILLSGDFPGTVIRIGLKGMEVLEENEDEVVVAFGAGENWHQCVMQAIDRGWGGIENMALIPGCIGAAPIQNIGAYGRELKDVFAHLDALPVAGGNSRRYDREACQFGYRDSIFKQEAKGKFIITKVALRLTKRHHSIDISYGAIRDELSAMGFDPEQADIRQVAEAVIRIRQSKLPDPSQIGNAGSFFKNPEITLAQFEQLKSQYPAMPSYDVDASKKKIPAGWLIEQCGWKGKRLGNHGVHDKQALVLVNYGGAKGKEIFDLSSAILQTVRMTFGIDLEREVNVV